MYIGLKMNTFVLHEFTMGDVEDPHIYVAAPIYEWQQTDQGKWAMEHGTNIKYHISPDDYSYGHKVKITGEFKNKHETFLRLVK